MITAWIAYLADVDQTTHEVSVAEGVDGVLGLFPGLIFHNPRDSMVSQWSLWPMGRNRRNDLPASLHDPQTTSPNPSIQHSSQITMKNKR